MKKIIIPRKDHEVYFIQVPEGLKTKLIRSFIIEQLDKMHPAFSNSSAFDLKQIVFGKSHWVAATVMDAETLAEYKILHNGAIFYTNTSIAIHKKDFINRGIGIFDDEYIGFDAERNKPISIQLESEKTSGTSAFEADLKKTKVRYGVFRKKLPRLYVAAISIFLFLLVTSSIFISAAKPSNSAKDFEEIPEQFISELKYLPSAIEMLADISFDIVNTNGKMMRWQYNEEAEPFIAIQMLGVDVSKVHAICMQYEYVFLQDIQDVSYNEGEPVLTIYLEAKKAEYLVHKTGTFSAQSSALSMIADLSNNLSEHNISIISETLPAGSNGNAFYTITYTAKDWNLIRSMESIIGICNKYQLRVKNLDVSIENTSRFTVICTLSQSEMLNYSFSSQEKELEKIPKAFGYKNAVLAPAPQPVKTEIPRQEPSIVGSIKDGSGMTTFFRDAETGKLVTRGNNE